jgi:DnaJ-class molecular chaperone
MNLTKQIKEQQTLIIQTKSLHKKVIDSMENDLNTLRRMNDACEKCNGTGKRKVRFDSYGNEFVDVICNACNGTGLINKEKETENE